MLQCKTTSALYFNGRLPDCHAGDDRSIRSRATFSFISSISIFCFIFLCSVPMRATCSMRYLQRPSICCRPPPTHSLPSLLINRRFNSNLSSSPPPSSSSAPPPPPAQQPQSSQPPRPPPDAAPYFGRSPTSRFRRSQLWLVSHLEDEYFLIVHLGRISTALSAKEMQSKPSSCLNN